jgi:putative ABC transport system permease protein
MDVWKTAAGPGYFQTLGIRIIRGREFTASDNMPNPKIIVIDKNLAEQLWPGEDPVGKMLVLPEMTSSAYARLMKLVASPVRGESRKLFQDPRSYDQIPCQVVGEVETTRAFGLLPIQYSTIYYPYSQIPRDLALHSQSFFLRTAGNPSALAKTATGVIQSLNLGLPVIDAETLQQRAAGAIGGRGSNRLLVVVGTVTSGLGLLLATLGIYGVLAYSTALRTREIGIRIALGAQRGQIFRMVLGRGLLLTIAGILLGVLGAIATTRMLGRYLFALTPTDPMTFTGVAVLFLIVASLACYSPARRAMRVKHMTAIRYE